MKILHTADWHLADRLGRIDRTDDLRRAVERVGIYCESEKIDVLLVAGDLFSELARPDALRESIRHWQNVFAKFLSDGGTILTLTGNHDNEGFCQTLTHAMNLAAPLSGNYGQVVPNGRLYLATEPTLLRLHDRHHGYPVQFLLMPYPTPGRYLRDESSRKYASLDEKNRTLIAAFTDTLRTIQSHPSFDERLPTVLGAHIHVRGATLGTTLFRLTEEEDAVFDESALPSQFAYVALGHIHRPQAIGGHDHVRYSGSIERMDLGEKDDQKCVIVVEVGEQGRLGNVEVLPLPATPIYELTIQNPSEEIPELQRTYHEAESDLVNLHLLYTAGKDNLEDNLRALDSIFPRWYSRDWKEASALRPTLARETSRSKSFAETVREYIDKELIQHSEEERAAILERLEALIQEMEL